MELKKKSNILDEEEPKYIISLKKGYRILHIIMSIFFLSCTLYFGMIFISCRYRYDWFLILDLQGICFLLFFYYICGVKQNATH